MSRPDIPHRVDLLVVGSGPVGSAIARRVHDTVPSARILMVDLGPRLTERTGLHLHNLPVEERREPQTKSQGRDPATAPGEDGALAKKYADRGTHLLKPRREGEPEQDGMPAAVMSSNVGGMGVHWACTAPRPLDSERIPFLTDDELDAALEAAEALLTVAHDPFPRTPGGQLVLETLRDLFDHEYPEGRYPRPMPLACSPRPGTRPHWAGPDMILGPLADGEDSRFRIAAETICRRVLFEGNRATGVVLEHLPTGAEYTVRARAVAVAADPLRTPQLLWASGIRPDALAHYLNDQPKIVSSVRVENGPTAGTGAQGSVEFTGDIRDLETARFQVPFAAPGRPHHGQVITVDTSPVQGAEPGLFVGMVWYGVKEIQRSDRVEFSTSEADAYGMPKMTIHYTLTERDHEVIAQARADQERIAAALGSFLPGNEPALFPAGSSKHYQGSVRMGSTDDGTSVCDSSARVWGFENLYVGGNGVIPTATAVNPTLTSVALAVRTADAISAALLARF
ncbi:GMC oxidoreductase [Streptomyces coffeae]|uniref:GMC family oxidoreductase N-terminal domain-containing protein n=1 Tax=Streptomyces coffeae TaxID=621382 RepID=A0ABS1NS42_9ACTN|nr:GMC oxidoreductase [Streptomyces coffeae]MBL1102640.1 GMC family oxidoreductase N-terminal domain-containing protein [Streptomyces coffeae]